MLKGLGHEGLVSNVGKRELVADEVHGCFIFSCRSDGGPFGDRFERHGTVPRRIRVGPETVGSSRIAFPQVARGPHCAHDSTDSDGSKILLPSLSFYFMHHKHHLLTANNQHTSNVVHPTLDSLNDSNTQAVRCSLNLQLSDPKSIFYWRFCPSGHGDR
jgi:hypothetical protein